MQCIDADVSEALACEGRLAFYRYGESGEAKCPYPIHDARRTAWYHGYIAERTKTRLARHGIEV